MKRLSKLLHLSLSELRLLVETAIWLIVARMVILNVPFLAFPSNSHKIEGILDDCGCPELLISELSRVEEKRELAVKALERTRVYAEDAHKKIFQFYDKVLRI